jgi:hypothetical protein
MPFGVDPILHDLDSEVLQEGRFAAGWRRCRILTLTP